VRKGGGREKSRGDMEEKKEKGEKCIEHFYLPLYISVRRYRRGKEGGGEKIGKWNQGEGKGKNEEGGRWKRVSVSDNETPTGSRRKRRGHGKRKRQKKGGGKKGGKKK